ncbi:MAG: hypothetical protein IAE89_08240 [Anaerolineae bacterium]|nr:hypothetical protein [Anaerolineae bacterium]
MLAVQAAPHLRREDAPIAILPPSERYFEQMCELDAVCYLIEDRKAWATPKYYRAQSANFAEGQFIAVDTGTDRVVGLTSCMRIDFDPKQPLLSSWNHTTNYG